MFEQCSAYVISSEIEWQSRLSYVLRQVGFSECIRLSSTRGILPLHPTHLPFLLIHSNADKQFALKSVDQVRTNGDDAIRFMPIIMLTDEQSERTIQKFLALGCDDIVLYPCTAPPLAKRLRMQILQSQKYFQTQSYFGPDRRRNETAPPHPDRRGGKGSLYQNFEIKRDVRGGVKILSSQTFEPQPAENTDSIAWQ